jgi:hypothetical protein
VLDRFNTNPSPKSESSNGSESPQAGSRESTRWNGSSGSCNDDGDYDADCIVCDLLDDAAFAGRVFSNWRNGW